MGKVRDIAAVHEQFIEAIVTTDAPLTEQEQALLLKEADHLPFHWLQRAYRKAKKQTLHIAVKLAQEGTLLLLNRLHARLRKNASPFHEHLQEKLTHFINYLRKHYQPYFDTKTPMPDNMWLAIKTQVDTLLEPGEASVLLHADDELAALLRNQYQNATMHGTPNYHTAEYWLQLKGALQGSLQVNEVTLSTIYILVASNFNSAAFVTYLLQRFTHALPAEGDANDHWAEHLRQLNRIVDRPGMCFDPGNRSCKELLFASINDEMRAHSFSRYLAPAFEAPVSFKTKLSAPQLALFYRLQVDLGIISVDNKHELMQQLAQVYQTPAGNISPKRLKDKFYNIEPSAIEAMKSYAIEMMNLLRKYEV
jgi:hypothetical protein